MNRKRDSHELPRWTVEWWHPHKRVWCRYGQQYTRKSGRYWAKWLRDTIKCPTRGVHLIKSDKAMSKDAYVSVSDAIKAYK